MGLDVTSAGPPTNNEGKDSSNSESAKPPGGRSRFNSATRPPAILVDGHDHAKDGEKHVHFNQGSHFEPTHEVYTPKVIHENIKYRTPTARSKIGQAIAPQGSMVRPNYEDTLRRVSVVLYQHITRGERRLRHRLSVTAAAVSPTASSPSSIFTDLHTSHVSDEHHHVDTPTGLATSMSVGKALTEGEDTSFMFHEDLFVLPTYKYRFLRLPMTPLLSLYSMEPLNNDYKIPTVEQIYKFCRHLFTNAQLGSECTIVCLVYVERLMELANVHLLAVNWKPIVLCGLLLSSKVWQDLSSWNIEFTAIFPQFSLKNINRLERIFLQHIQWDLHITGSVYAKYYFALRSMTEKKDFRRRYNYVMHVNPPNSKLLEERSMAIKDQLYSTSV